MMQVQFWGTRGSIPRPVRDTLRYGGNTSCVEVRTGAGTLVVLDCGTGAYDLGQSLMESGVKRGHLFITHTHWDHIQGFPFFAPLFQPGAEWDVYGPGGVSKQLEQTLGGQMAYPYFPVNLGQLGATVRFHDLSEGSFQLDDVRVTTKYLNHPAVALGYRLENGGSSLVYAVDHEPSDDQDEESKHLAFMAGATLLIHDTQYTAAEYPAKKGWGHSPVEHVVNAASDANVERLALFHHDPLRDDPSLTRVVESARQQAEKLGPLDVFAAAQGQHLTLRGDSHSPREKSSFRDTTTVPAPHRPPVVTVLVADRDPHVLRLMTEALRPQGFRLVTAYDGEEALSLARRERPDLVLLDWNLQGRSALEICKALRDGPVPELRRVPIVILSDEWGPEAARISSEAGITEHLLKPISSAHLLSRISTWVLRTI